MEQEGQATVAVGTEVQPGESSRSLRTWSRGRGCLLLVRETGRLLDRKRGHMLGGGCLIPSLSPTSSGAASAASKTVS